MAKVEKRKRRKTDNVIIILFTVIIIIVIGITYYSNFSIKEYVNIIQDNINKRLILELEYVESMVTVEQIEGYRVPADMEKESYRALLKEIQDYADEKDLVYIYFMRLVGDQVQYIIDSDPNPETRCDLDYFEEPYWLLLEAYKGEPVFNLIGDYQEGWEGLLSAYAPIFNDNGDIIAIVGIDVSDKEVVSRQQEAKLLSNINIFLTMALGVTSIIFIISYRKKAQDADAANVAKSQFLSKMSHEIRTPMNAIIGFYRMAKRTDDISRKNKYLDSISSASDYLLELINAILDVSKIEAKKMSLIIEKASIVNLVKNIEVILAPQIVKKDQNFNIKVSDNIPEYLYCDKTRLTQIIVNLAANAIKFTPEKGEISLEVFLIGKAEDTCNLGFSIKDNGIGMEEEILSKLFVPFEQGDESITRKFGGTGLGLSISKHFIELMKGSISVTSVIGQGSTFKFDIWLDIVPEWDYPNDDPNKEKSLNATDIVDCIGMEFLVAEDSQVNQVIANDILQELGATVEFASNGNECFEKFTANPNKYKIIFMDIQMPEMDGLETTKKIRECGLENAGTIPIVAMTAEVFQEDINKALDAGMNEHLGKPLDVREVASVIKEVLKNR